MSLVYAGENSFQVDLARSTLQDLRDVVSRHSQNDIKLSLLLGDVFAEQQQRCEKLDITLNYDVSNIAFDSSLKAGGALLITRLVRELVGVGIHQLRGQILTLNCLSGYSGLELSLSFECQNIDIDTASLVIRANRLSGSVSLISEGSTSELICWLPTAPHKEGVNDLSVEHYPIQSN